MIVHAVVQCTGISGVESSETAFGGTDNQNECSGPRWCNYIPLELNDGCSPGCDGITPFDSECQNNACKPIYKPDCDTQCKVDGKKQNRVCEAGECKNTTIIECPPEFLELKTVQTFTCDDGLCVKGDLDYCSDNCTSGMLLNVEECDNGQCVTKPKPCENYCDANGKVVESECDSTTNTCKEETKDCDDECSFTNGFDVAINRECIGGACQTTPKTCPGCSTCTVDDNIALCGTPTECKDECSTANGFDVAINRECSGSICKSTEETCSTCSTCSVVYGVAECGP